ncbi:glutamine synthetase [Siphonobacter sp. BAB-5385]|uniref:Glutamine synthetase n=1 Tax=Siphonobacter curvatus TaxID=2094562 RepID=A0A2S7IQ99_9BACT|nr:MULTISPECIES: glutamine synthetase beta-grasp domain-containing protein [Siphonobacter]OZI09271.1 glutamine synthetase [Siphonobacter sp. BAB-5385]PMD98867.1 glutamine synthetase [Siphonobacter sp. BAB-5405]PQA59885.1 glutamine synthetase [Siphonobacter curvatus]
MAKAKLEYIWLDGYKPMQSLRSKTKIVDDFSGNLEELDMWSFDGSSTEQAPGRSSDCLLKPVFVCKDPARLGGNGWLVMCEVLNANGTAHESNGRATIDDDDNDFWFGFEQEYFLWDPATNKPLGFPAGGYPGPQGPYYCSVGAGKAVGRDIVEEHLELCLQAGLNVEGINAEVAMGQWEFQVFAKGAKQAGDETWIARYLLERVGEKYNVAINWHCKPLGTLDWNGSGMHANFSNTVLRTSGSKEAYETILEAFRPVVKEHVAVYGPDNHLRLTGKHETAAINKFSWGISDRGSSIRVPIATVERGWKGWLEDRRPNSAADPYKVAARIIKTVKSAEVE